MDERAFAVCLEFPELKEVDVCGVTASGGGPLPRPWPDVRHPNVTDEHLKLLSKSKRLEAIGFSGAAVTNDGLKSLAALNRLRYLNLSDTNVTDEGLRNLKVIRSLEQLCIGRTNLLDQGAHELKKALPNCEIVW